MRIISGKFKGKRIISPQDKKIRPTSDRAKEMIFNTLVSILKQKQIFIENINVLDIYCGTGSLGLEAISRGAKSVTFIDKSANAILLAKENCSNLNIFKNVSFLKKDLFKINEIKKKFNLFFIDPPYKEGLINRSINFLIQNEFLEKNSLGVIEYQAKKKIQLTKSINIIKTKKIGISEFIFIEKL